MVSETARLDEMSSALHTMDMGRGSIVQQVITDLRWLLDLDDASVWRFAIDGEGVSLSALEGAGLRLPPSKTFEVAAARAKGGGSVGALQPLLPEPAQRNRALVIDSSVDVVARRLEQEPEMRRSFGLRPRELARRLEAFAETERRVLKPLGWTGKQQPRPA